MTAPATRSPRGPGRPPVGDRVVVRLPEEQLAEIDRRASALGRSRASVIRSLLDSSLGRAPVVDDGVDRAQLHRALAMSPAERMHHALDLAAQQRRFRGAVRPGR